MILARNNISVYPNLLVGLESFWKLNDNSIDSVGTNDGTDVNVGYAHGKFGKGADFNADPTSYIVLGSDIPSINNASEFTVSCWVKFKTIENLQRIISKWNYLSQGSWAVTQAAAGGPDRYGIYFFICNATNDAGGNVVYTNVPGGFVIDTWYHICCVFDGSQPSEITRAKIYINGVNETVGFIGAINTTTTSGNDPIRLGLFNSDSNYPANNIIDEVGVWSRALTQEEVTQLYISSYPYNSRVLNLERKPTIFNGLTAYWRMDGNSVDAVGTNNGSDTAITYPTGEYATFNGSSSVITVPSNIYLSTGDLDFTICAWVNLTSKTNPTFGNGIAGKWKYTTNNKEYILWFDTTNDRFRFEVSNDGTSNANVQASSFGSPSTGVWYFVVAWHDSINNTINIQVNNGTVDSTAHSTGVYVGNGPFEFGSYDGQAFIDGSIGDVGFWKKVLTAEERAYLYNSGTGHQYPFNLEKIQRYYKFEGDSVDAVAGNNGTDTDMTYSVGVIKKGAYFNGTTSKIDITSFQVDINGTNEYTFSFWIYGITTGAGLGGVLTSANYGLNYYSNTNYCGFSCNLVTASSAVLAANAWSHISCTIDTAGNVQFYVNGVLGGTAGLLSGTHNLGTFGYFLSYAAYLDTDLDEFAIWNRKLTQAEITSLYNNGRGLQYPFYETTKTILSYENKITQDGLLYWYDASRVESYPGSGNVWYDISGNGYHGTFTSAPYVLNNTFEFDTGAKNYYMDAPVSFGTIYNMTITIWFKMTTTATFQYPLLIGKDATSIQLYFDFNDSDSGSIYRGVWVYWNGGGSKLAAISPDGTNGIHSQFANSQWWCYTFRRDISDSIVNRHYVNGVEVTTGTQTLGSQTEAWFYDTPNRVALGNNLINSFTGQIGTSYAYNRALTASEILYNYEIHKNKFI